MCWLFLEIALLLDGLRILVAGNARFTDRLAAEGWPARLVGLLLMAPIPLTFVIALGLGVLGQLGIVGMIDESAASRLEIMVTVLCVAGALAVLWVQGRTEE
jgi:hypothetical protein